MFGLLGQRFRDTQRKPPLGAKLIPGHPHNNGLVFRALFNEGVGLANESTRPRTASPTWSVGPSGSYGDAWSYAAADTADLNFTGPFSVGAWCRIIAISVSNGVDFPQIFARRSYTNESVNAGWELQGRKSAAPGDDGINFFVYNNNGVANYQLPAAYPAVGDHLIMGTTDGVTRRIYIDGILKNSTTTNPISGTVSATAINAPFGATAARTIPTYGVAAWNRCLSADDVMELYINPFAGIWSPSTRLYSYAPSAPSGFKPWFVPNNLAA